MHIVKSRPDGFAFDRCIASATASRLRFQVIDNMGRDVLVGRKKGFYADSSATHLTMLDDDDETLLTPEIVEHLIGLNKPAVFANSEIIGDSITSQNVPNFVQEWSLGMEKNRLCRPHAPMVLEVEYARHILNDTEKLLNTMNWHPNHCDYVFRLIISTTIGWKYENIIAYRWYIHDANLHRSDNPGINEIRNYFFDRGKACK